MQILTVNVGSSSLKLALWAMDGTRAEIELEARGIGGGSGSLTADGRLVAQEACTDHRAALAALLRHLPKGARIAAVGHRVVHGGAHYRNAVRLNESVLRELEALIPLSPLHQPPALAVIDACRLQFPDLPQAAVFDTAFHAQLPPRASIYAVPAAWREAGLRRYGFHGIACADAVAQLGPGLRRRAVILHLGAGCSATALLDGRSVDTTMGFTPLEGLVMATRSGDLDPGVLLYMQRERGLTPAQADHVLNEESGLLGLTGDCADMRLLLQRGDAAAALAVEVFCYRAAKAAAGLTVALGGLDQLLFSGGIGEHAGAVRRRIGTLLHGFGVDVDAGANEAGAAVISLPGSAVEVRVVAVDEGRCIARETARLMHTDG
jgi:acetate kinase